MQQISTLSYFGISDIGLVRPNNEDSWVALPESSFFAIADGMGGEKGGEVASKEGLSHLTDAMKKREKELSENELRELIEQANQWVYQIGCSSELLTGMGTTLCCLQFTQDSVLYAHVGDSRIYRYRDQKLQCLTTDHSYYEKWREKMDGSQTAFSYKHVITRALGSPGRAQPEIVRTAIESKDLYLLCTDGISDALSIEEMEALLCASDDLETIAHEFIKQAKIKGSPDNMTLLAVQCI